jgi:hypothetical protein
VRQGGGSVQGKGYLKSEREKEEGQRVGSEKLLYSERCIAQKLLVGESFHGDPWDSTSFDAPATPHYSLHLRSSGLLRCPVESRTDS